jgi:hypothetical protein
MEFKEEGMNMEVSSSWEIVVNEVSSGGIKISLESEKYDSYQELPLIKNSGSQNPEMKLALVNLPVAHLATNDANTKASKTSTQASSINKASTRDTSLRFVPKAPLADLDGACSGVLFGWYGCVIDQ